MTRDPQQLLAQVVGAVLTLVGVAGFLTGGMLFIFGVNALHNVVHLLSGVLGLAAGFYAGGQWARHYNQGFGVVLPARHRPRICGPRPNGKPAGDQSRRQLPAPSARHRAGRRRIRRPIKSNGVRSNPMKGFPFPLVLVSA
jgi:hypothetical protein